MNDGRCRSTQWKMVGLTIACILLNGCSKPKEQSKADVGAQIKQLILAAKLYSGDGAGEFPKSLSELKPVFFEQVPKYRCADGSERDFIYISGFSETSDPRLAFLASPAIEGEKLRWVGTVGGDVKVLPSDTVEKMLFEAKKFLE